MSVGFVLECGENCPRAYRCGVIPLGSGEGSGTMCTSALGVLARKAEEQVGKRANIRIVTKCQSPDILQIVATRSGPSRPGVGKHVELVVARGVLDTILKTKKD